MLSYKIHRSTSYECSKRNCVTRLHNAKYCFGVNLYKFNENIYGKYIRNNHFNANVYYMIYDRSGVLDIQKLYLDCKKQYNNVQSEYLIDVYEDNILKTSVVIMVYKLHYVNPKYTYAINATDSGANWPSIIPEEYKSECVYVEYPEPYKPVEITNENIVSNNGVLYVNNKPLDNSGYYRNKDDMYKIDGGVCEVHLPFNIIRVNDIPEDILKYKLNFINDNEQLEGHCKLCILDYNNKVKNLNIFNTDILISNKSDGKLFNELITFNKTI